MANHDRLKRRLLRELVNENVALIEGRAHRRSRSHPVSRVVRLLGFTLLPLSMLGFLHQLPAEPPAVSPPRFLEPLPSESAPPAKNEAMASSLPASVDASVFPLAIRRVVIDPGHGGGSLGTHSPGGITEKEITLDVALRLKRLLTDGSFEVLMTREDDRPVTLRERALAANEAKADLFVSIHVNWIGNRAVRGVETYFMGPTNDPLLSQLAAAENRESGYSMADLRQLLDRLYLGVRQDNSRQLAHSVQSSLLRSLRKINPHLEDRGIKPAPFVVLLSTEMPAVLAEVSCLSNEDEASLLAKPLYRQFIAEALAEGVQSYADLLAQAPQDSEKGI
jgi:N-acetylmuramoyl-L-alanine amidase